MSKRINHDPTNDPGFPASSDMIDDTEGHGRRALLDDADEGDTVRARRGDPGNDADNDTEGHGRYR